MAVNEFKLPDVGEGLTEAEIVTWMVKVGDVIKINDIICEIETAKSLVELPSPYAGTVSSLLVAEGQTVAVGTPIIGVSSGDSAAGVSSSDGAIPEIEPAPAAAAVEPGMVGSPAPNADTSDPSDNGDAPGTLVGYGPRAQSASRRARKTAMPAASAAPAAQAVQAVPEPAAPAPVATAPAHVAVLAKPPVRKLAKDLGVDLASVSPTGPNGTISRSDVEAAASGSGADSGALQVVEQPLATVTSISRGDRETRIVVKGVRKMTAQSMVASAFTAPHVTEWITVDVTKTMKLVERLKADRGFSGVKVSPLLVFARAVCVAIRKTPEVNATWDEAAQEIVLKHYVNLGIAAATPRGLVVPNVKDADALSTLDLAAALNNLVAVARSGKTQPAEMSQGTFTITNVGVFGVDAGTPILNPGETGILALGAIRLQPWVVRGKIKPRWITTLALSFDHRVVDGQQGSQFLADVASIAEDPGNTLLL
jgi:2-oxoisovalerate dehydrogenase E2 component (dihydrolipoyl transacylase)